MIRLKRRLWAAAAIVACALAPVLAQSARADAVTDWNNVALDAIKVNKDTSVKSSRVLAMVHLAVFDSVNSVERKYEPYCVNVVVSADISAEAAAAVAAHDVLAGVYPAQAAAFKVALYASLAKVADGDAKESGIALGRYVAGRVLALRANDRSGDVVPYAPGQDPGQWRPTPPAMAPAMLPNWAAVTPFVINKPEQFRRHGPPALSSLRYAADFNEVKVLGAKASAVRTPTQTEIAMFWADMPGTVTTAGRWNQIAQSAALSRKLSLVETARLFAMLNVSLADAGVAAWDAKYAYGFWRPITAIREADTDDNRRTARDPEWEPLLATPAFPEYVSAHSTFSGAAATTLGLFFGTDKVSFSVPSYVMPTTYKAFSSFQAAADEAGRSRVYGGIHFTSANLSGLWRGREVALYVWRHSMRPGSHGFLLAKAGGERP